MELELNYAELGQRIRKYRQAAHMTQEQLGEKIDMATSNISHIERATTQVSLPSLVKIANALGVSLDQLVCDSLSVMSSACLDKDIAELLGSCTPKEKKIIRNIIEVTIKTLQEQ